MINELVFKKAKDGDGDSLCELLQPIKESMYKVALTYTENEDDALDCYIIPVEQEQKEFSFALLSALRILGIKSEIDYLNRSIKSNFKQAEKLKSKFVIIIGESELNEGYLTIKNMQTKEEEQVANEMVINYLFEKLDDDCTCGDDCTCDDDCGSHGHCNCKE